MPVISTHSLMFDPQISIFSTLEPIKTALLEILCESYRPTYQKLLKDPEMSSEIWICLFQVVSPFLSQLHHTTQIHGTISPPNQQYVGVTHIDGSSLSDWLLMHRGEKRKGRLLHISSLIIHSFTHTHPPTANAASILTRAERLHSFQLTTGFE